jgi:hypothetical protein
MSPSHKRDVLVTTEHSAESDTDARMDREHACCGSCGQHLWWVDGGKLANLLSEMGGRRLDAQGVWRPTTEHQNQRKRHEARLQDADLPRIERQVSRRRLAQNYFSRETEHTNDPRKPIRTGADRIVKIPAPGTPPPQSFGITEMPGNPRGIKAGSHRLKETWTVDQLSSRLADALQLPARVECPRCHRTNRISKA